MSLPASPAAGLRVVAVFEAVKGLLVIAAGGGLVAAIHTGLAEVVDQLVGHLHLNAANGYPRIFVDLARHTSNTQLWLLAGAAFAYATVRLTEAYGLWHGRRWAEWFAVASGGLYVPLELYELGRGFSALKLATLLVNVAIVLYLAYAMRASRQAAGATISTAATASASAKPNTVA